MTRTTLSIDDEVLKRMKEKAASEGRTLQDIANELLKQALMMQRPRKRKKLTLMGWGATLSAGVDLLDRDHLFDLMDGRGV